MKSVLAALVSIAALPATAQDVSFMRLLPGWETEAGTRMIGVEILLNPGWKTYWRAPGPGGIPPMFDWAGSENVRGATVHWPRPDVQHAFGLTNLGYQDRVVFPVEITPEDPSAPTDITLALSYGVCGMCAFLPIRRTASAATASPMTAPPAR
ncbi:MAG: protein-disulfide reductase DsbD domain-containing protein [Pseudomonadota bacterium]